MSDCVDLVDFNDDFLVDFDGAQLVDFGECSPNFPAFDFLITDNPPRPNDCCGCFF